MKKIFIAFVIIAASFTAASCQKENALANGGQSSSPSPVFTASIDNEIGTKTTIEKVAGTPVAYKVAWEATDKISVNGAVYTATPDGSDPTKATFTKESGEDPTGTFYAYFPSTIYNGVTGTLPPVQTYVAGKLNAPMFAQSTTASLSFKNICAVLAVKVKSTEMATVKKIRVSSSNCAVSGDFIISAGDNKLYLLNPGAIENKVILDCGEGVATTAEGTVFYITIPPQKYVNLLIELSEDGTSYPKAMCTDPYTSIIVDPSSLYSVDFEEMIIYTVGNFSAAAITAGGYTWAPVNCGYDKDHPYGLLYQWGRKYGQASEVGTITPETMTFAQGQQASNSLKFAKFAASTYYHWWYSGTQDWTAWNYLTKGAYDPCPTGWRLPEDNAFITILGGLPSGSEYGYYGDGMYEGIKGIYLDGTLTPTKDSGVFFPAGGRRTETGLVEGQGAVNPSNESQCCYWTSEGYNAGHFMEISQWGFFVDQNYVVDGYSLRCIKE